VCGSPRERRIMATPCPLLFLFGSETGNAEGLCHEFHNQAVSLGHPARIAPLNDFDSVGFQQAPTVIIICSTSGDGEPPENARKFVRWLKKKTHAPDTLQGMRFGVLALGDTNYTHFCRAGRTIDTRLAEMGARALVPRGDADDAVGLEAVVEPWKAALWNALSQPAAPIPRGPPAVTAEATDLGSCSGERRPTDRPVDCAATPESPARPLLVLFGSETGNAAELSHDLHREALARGCASRVSSLNDYESVGFQKATVVVIVCSTTGDAEPPQNARKFVRWLKRKTHPEDLLSSMRYALLALGDTNYSGFCRAGRMIDQRLRQLGATPFVDRGDADEAVGLELVVEPWRTALWAALPRVLHAAPAEAPSPSCQDNRLGAPGIRSNGMLPAPGAMSPGTSRSSSPGLTDSTASRPPSRLNIRPRTSATAAHEETAANWSPDRPFMASLESWQRMTTSDATRQVIRMTLRVPGWSWAPGDSIGVVPQNDAETVRQLLARLGVDPATPFPRPSDERDAYIYSKIPFPEPPRSLTVEEVLTRYIDLYPKDTKAILVLAQFLPKTSDAEAERAQLKEWLMVATAFRSQVILRRESILDILNHTAPHSCPEVAHLVKCLRPLQPRYYSIASSPLHRSDYLDIAFTVVDYVPPKRTDRVRGVCTSWLEGLCLDFDQKQASGQTPDIQIPIFLKPTHTFTLPTNPRAPIIMIGAGSGVAPFISFLQHRRKQMTDASHLLPPLSPYDAPSLTIASPTLHSVCSKDDVSTTSTESAEARGWGETHLFFGCRHRNVDFLFREEVESFVEDGTLTTLHLALSKEGEEGRWYGGCYVQDKMMESSLRLCHLIMACRAHIYVCGDAQSTARDVRGILLDILAEQEGLGSEEAKAILQHLTHLGRYHEDIY